MRVGPSEEFVGDNQVPYHFHLRLSSSYLIQHTSSPSALARGVTVSTQIKEELRGRESLGTSPAAEMSKLRLCSTSNNSQIAAPMSLPVVHPFQFTPTIFRVNVKVQKTRAHEISASKSSGFPLGPIWKGCQACGGKGAIECPGCKGTGKNKKNGNIFERWKCFDCQGFGLKSCPNCGRGGLTPEQRGER